LKIPLCKVEEIPEEGTKTVAFLDREVLAFKIEGRPKAVARCGEKLTGWSANCIAPNLIAAPANA
jgi:hypothetical protein